MAAKCFISRSLSGSVGMTLCAVRPDHMLAGRFYVDGVISEGPIAKAGISGNDVLMKIDDEDVLGKSQYEVTEILKVTCPDPSAFPHVHRNIISAEIPASHPYPAHSFSP